ncbi:hypothetical protein [Cupriavidus plantarum]|uniref:hypothetical protein n=1 Tax=Cupriavidus plantarum TaxID=942865 RepID=UPI000F221D86|nr:hypothetical protein [Cupriavidus plantarum]RLK45705.1 hypothetical protein C7417_1727 [Cupriavidus plantarum]
MKHDARINRLPLTREQRYFAACWFNMVHAHSLDSHRVRVMHGLNIIEEFLRLCSVSHGKDDRLPVGREAVVILKQDAVLQRGRLHVPATKLLKLLEPSILNKESLESQRLLLDSYSREFVDALQEHYLPELLRYLKMALLDPDGRPEAERFAEIHSLTGSLLSRLLADGQSLEGLFQLYRQTLVKDNGPEPYLFAERFDMLVDIISSPVVKWDVCFAVDGITDVEAFPTCIGDIVFSKALPPGAEVPRKLQAHGHRRYASGVACAAAARSAGTLLHDRINRVLDLVRFEYDQANIQISDEFVIRRADEGGRWRVLPIPKVVPNPRATMTSEELSAFTEGVDRLVTGDRFSEEGRDRVLSAFRLYRVGADNRSFENKLVNWWTGLEYLAKGASSGGSIAVVVENSVIPLLLGASLHSKLDACRSILIEHSVDLLDAGTRAPIDLKPLPSTKLAALFCDPGHTARIAEGLVEQPLVAAWAEQLLGNLRDPDALHGMMTKSEQRLRWHLQRLYRARCDIVHSACRFVNVSLLCANLEAYLKAVLSAILAGFSRIATLVTPQEFFIRSEHEYREAMRALKAGDTTVMFEWIDTVKL